MPDFKTPLATMESAQHFNSVKDRLNQMEIQEKQQIGRLRNKAANAGRDTAQLLKEKWDNLDLSAHKKQAANVLLVIGAVVVATQLIKRTPKGFFSTLISGAVKASIAAAIANKVAPKSFNLN